MGELSHANLRAVLVVLLNRMGGAVDISNAELYDAMMPDSQAGEWIAINDTASGVRVSLHRDPKPPNSAAASRQ